MVRQIVVNATEFTSTDVDWPGYPALFEMEYPNLVVQVMQIHFWSPTMQTWVKLVSQKSGEQGVIEITIEDTEMVKRGMAEGLPRAEAIRQVLGIALAAPIGFDRGV